VIIVTSLEKEITYHHHLTRANDIQNVYSDHWYMGWQWRHSFNSSKQCHVGDTLF